VGWCRRCFTSPKYQEDNFIYNTTKPPPNDSVIRVIMLSYWHELTLIWWYELEKSKKKIDKISNKSINVPSDFRCRVSESPTVRDPFKPSTQLTNVLSDFRCSCTMCVKGLCTIEITVDAILARLVLVYAVLSIANKSIIVPSVICWQGGLVYCFSKEDEIH
jgi:hypothetical protein